MIFGCFWAPGGPNPFLYLELPKASFFSQEQATRHKQTQSTQADTIQSHSLCQVRNKQTKKGNHIETAFKGSNHICHISTFLLELGGNAVATFPPSS